MHAFKIFFLTTFLFGAYLAVKAGNPVPPVELKGPKAQEQTYVVKKTVNNIPLNKPAVKNTLNSPSQLYLPNNGHQSSDWVSLRDNVGRVINLVHLVGTGVIDLPHYTYANTGRLPVAQPNDVFRKRDIALVSTLSALCVAGVILGPVISSQTHVVRYNKTSYSKYAIVLSMNNELDFAVKF